MMMMMMMMIMIVMISTIKTTILTIITTTAMIMHILSLKKNHIYPIGSHSIDYDRDSS